MGKEEVRKEGRQGTSAVLTNLLDILGVLNLIK